MVEKFAEIRAILKLANAVMHEEDGKGGHCENWRETLLMNASSADQSSEE